MIDWYHHCTNGEKNKLSDSRAPNSLRLGNRVTLRKYELETNNHPMIHHLRAKAFSRGRAKNGQFCGRKNVDHSKYGTSTPIDISSPWPIKSLILRKPFRVCDTVSGVEFEYSSDRMIWGLPNNRLLSWYLGPPANWLNTPTELPLMLNIASRSEIASSTAGKNHEWPKIASSRD